jgi:hypothetical protein
MLTDFDLEINSGLPLLTTNLHMRYHYNTVKGSPDNEWTPCGLSTDKCKASSKGGIKKSIHHMYKEMTIAVLQSSMIKRKPYF